MLSAPSCTKPQIHSVSCAFKLGLAGKGCAKRQHHSILKSVEVRLAHVVVLVGSSGLRIIKGGGVELIITKTLLIKNLSFLGFYYNVKKVNNRNENLTKSKSNN